MALIRDRQLSNDDAQSLRDSAEHVTLCRALLCATAQALAVYGKRLWNSGGAGSQDLLTPARNATLQARAVERFEDAMQRRLTRPTPTPNAEACEPARAIVLSPFGDG